MLKIILLLISFSAFANEVPYFCNDTLNKMPTQARGRVKPLFVQAKETIKFVTGKTKLAGFDTTTTFCLISLQNMGLPNKIEVPIRVDHIKVKELLGMNIDDHSIPAKKAINLTDDLRLAIMKEKLNTAYKKDLKRYSRE